MASQKHTFVGIEAIDSEVRIVEVRQHGSRIQVAKVASAPLANGVVFRGSILQPAAFALTVRGLLDSQQIPSSAKVAFGLPLERLSFRNFDLPPSTQVELPLMVAGEALHHGLVSEESGVHAFLELNAHGSDALHPRSVAVFASDASCIDELRLFSSRAGVNISSLEPSSIGSLRSALAGNKDHADAFTLYLGPSGGELAFVSKGVIKAYRRLETGASSLFYENQKLAPVEPTHEFEGLEESSLIRPAHSQTIEDDDFNHAGLNLMAKEIQRTLNFFERQFPETGHVNRLFLLPQYPYQSVIAHHLAVLLGIPVEISAPDPKWATDDSVRSTLEGPEGSKFLGAIGLALHKAPLSLTGTPVVDLFYEERKEVKWLQTMKHLTGSFAVSGVAVLLAIIGWLVLSAQISIAKSKTAKANEKQKSVESETDSLAQIASHKLKQYMTLRREGVPLGSLADAVTNNLENGVGIVGLNVSPDLRVTISGEAQDEVAMLRSLQRMQASPLVQNLAITSFSRGKSNQGVSFQLAAQTISMDVVRLKGEGFEKTTPSGPAASPTSPPKGSNAVTGGAR